MGAGSAEFQGLSHLGSISTRESPTLSPAFLGEAARGRPNSCVRRSWYGRVLVKRVEGLATVDEWKRAYREINEFERILVADGMPPVKIFLHITPDEQIRGFRDRLTNPRKRWKLSYEDFRNRDRWKDYEAAIKEMMERTSTRNAPWYLVPANSKRFAPNRRIEYPCLSISRRRTSKTASA